MDRSLMDKSQRQRRVRGNSRLNQEEYSTGNPFDIILFYKLNASK